VSAAATASRSRLWQNLWVRLAVALAFADASIVVLALPQIVDRLHSSISHVVWVIVAYNLALIAGALAGIPLARRLARSSALVAGLVLFGAASIGCGAAGSLSVLVPLRCVQGVGGALVLCSSLPLFTGVARPGDSPLIGWSAAAAVGAAVGPAAGGVLTQLFDWRSIFFAQAPVAALAAVAVLAAGVRGQPHRDPAPAPGTPEPAPGGPGSPAAPGAAIANAALLLLSAGLIGALFLVVIEMINGWLVSPIGAAAIVTTIPVTTALAERLVRGRSVLVLGAAGSVLVAGGLLCLSAITHRQLGLVVLALALCGTGLGLGFPGLTAAALRSPGQIAARAARTVAARDAGLVLGLLVLTPVFVARLNAAPAAATAQAAGEVIVAPLPDATKLALASRLQAVAAAAPQSRPPDIGPVFRQLEAGAPPAQRAALVALQGRLADIIQRAATEPFRRPFLYGALFALGVLPLLALGHALRLRRLRG
jgi:predicted MFS family arabinose efflux permease